MSTLVSVCGYCGSRDQTFDVACHEMNRDGVTITIGARCRQCRKISCMTIVGTSSPQHARNELNTPNDATHAIAILERVPLVREHAAPAHVPPEVAKAYVQAEKLSESQDMSEPAAVMYGRTVEIALAEAFKLRGIPLPSGPLIKRIDAAAAQSLLPSDLAEWSHEVRQLRNDGAHGDTVEHSEVLELQGFVELLLRYLFTLPGMMAERRLKKTTPAAA